ncbi:MAG TPA: hypothetical protein VL282_04435 [Tepidisphaeraceae bacterium]|nr:hypothetical protein [Tepidisphaeraceae bacterium]
MPPLLLDSPPRRSIPLDDRLPPDIPFDDEGDDDDRDPTRWVTVATFWQPTHAHIARLKLESEDIDCVIIDENLVATDWLYANAVGGIKLQVHEGDAARARELLHVTDEKEELIERCPNCDSTRVGFEKFANSWSFVLILVVGLLLLFVQPLIGLVIFLPLIAFGFGAQRTCEQCGYRWRSKRSLGPRGFEVVTNHTTHRDEEE